MKVLVLGGTQFVGRRIVEALLAAGHDVTLLNRGKTGTEHFPDLSHVTANRDEVIPSLDELSLDAIVDCSGYRPGQVKRIADALATKPYYLFISTISIYSEYDVDSINEDSPVFATDGITDPDSCPINGENYGPLKVMCENVVREEFPAYGIVRPGLVVGPYDHTDRLSYWPWRVSKGGRMAVPARLDQPVQGIDARDLARLVRLFVEGKIQDTVNGVGPGEPTTLGGLLEACKVVTAAETEFITLTTEQEEAANPRWPGTVRSDGSSDGIFSVDASRAKAHGLTNLPLEQTLRDILAETGARQALKAGWSLEEEAAFLNSI